MKIKKIYLILGIILLLILVFVLLNKNIEGFVVFNGEDSNTNEGQTSQVQIYPLSQEEINKVGQTILSSDFIGDIPENGAIALRFYNFKNNQRIWQSGFLIGKDKFLTEGEPDIYLSLHSKYISDLKGNNLCEVVKTASANGDLGVDTMESNAKLMMKYSGMLKHRYCFGF
jgi:hypothetical protein